MAIWQHDLRIIPRDKLAERGFLYGERLPANADRGGWWSAQEFPPELESQLQAALPRLAPWAPGWDVYGVEDGNRIDILREGAKIEEIKARLDARAPDTGFVESLVTITRFLNGVLLTPDLRVIEPDVYAIQEELAASPATAFVKGQGDSVDPP
jgi:hypothetical protein